MPMNRRFTFASRAVIIVVILCNEFIYFGPLITASTGFVRGPQCDTSLGLRQPEVWNASCHVRYCRSRQIIYISFINIQYICNIFITSSYSTICLPTLLRTSMKYPLLSLAYTSPFTPTGNNKCGHLEQGERERERERERQRERGRERE